MPLLFYIRAMKYEVCEQYILHEAIVKRIFEIDLSYPALHRWNPTLLSYIGATAKGR